MTPDSPPRAHFHLRKCAISQCVPAGSILVTKDFDLRGRPFGSKQRDAAVACIIPSEVACLAVALCEGSEESLEAVR